MSHNEIVTHIATELARDVVNIRMCHTLVSEYEELFKRHLETVYGAGEYVKHRYITDGGVTAWQPSFAMCEHNLIKTINHIGENNVKSNKIIGDSIKVLTSPSIKYYLSRAHHIKLRMLGFSGTVAVPPLSKIYNH